MPGCIFSCKKIFLFIVLCVLILFMVTNFFISLSRFLIDKIFSVRILCRMFLIKKYFLTFNEMVKSLKI